MGDNCLSTTIDILRRMKKVNTLLRNNEGESFVQFPEKANRAENGVVVANGQIAEV